MTLGLKTGLDRWLRATEENRDGPARVEDAIEREAGAAMAVVCRSREERTADAILSRVFCDNQLGSRCLGAGITTRRTAGSTSEDVVKSSRSSMMLEAC